MVVEDGGQIVAYLVGGICEREEYRLPAKMSELEQMFVTAAYRPKGVGKKLVDEFIKWSKEQEVKTVKVYANSENPRAVDFYRGEGFKDYSVHLELEI